MNSPGELTLIVPPYTQISEHEFVRAGLFATNTLGLPVIHGVGVLGTQGPGVPDILINVGHAGEEHRAKGIIFTNGL